MSFEIERVIIRGEMPEGCEDCDRHEGVYVSCWDGAKPTMYAVDCSVADMSTHDWEVDYASRPAWCPLVIVPKCIMNDILMSEFLKSGTMPQGEGSDQ